MWYKFEKGNPLCIPRIKQYQVAWYDMDDNGKCFDEELYSPDKIDKVITYVETAKDESNVDRRKVFVYFDNGDIYELKMEKVN